MQCYRQCTCFHYMLNHIFPNSRSVFCRNGMRGCEFFTALGISSVGGHILSWHYSCSEGEQMQRKSHFWLSTDSCRYVSKYSTTHPLYKLNMLFPKNAVRHKPLFETLSSSITCKFNHFLNRRCKTGRVLCHDYRTAWKRGNLVYSNCSYINRSWSKFLCQI